MFKKKQKRRPVLKSGTGRPSDEELKRLRQAPVGEAQPNFGKQDKEEPDPNYYDPLNPTPPSQSQPLVSETHQDFTQRPLEPEPEPTRQLPQPLQEPTPTPPTPEPLPERDEDMEMIILAREYLKKLKQINRNMQQLALGAQEYTEALEEMMKENEQ